MTLQEEVGQKMILGTATDQDILAAEWDWFVVQGKPQSMGKRDGEMVCKYRAGKSKRCAVGIFIPDNRYKREMEGGDLNDLFDLDDGCMLEFIKYRDLLSDLQDAHDGDRSPADFAVYMKRTLLMLGYKEKEVENADSITVI